MKRAILLTLAFILLSAPAFAATVTLKWDAVTGASTYNVYMSTDTGKTWTKVASGLTTTSTTLANVPATGLVMFKASWVSSGAKETTTDWKGGWFDATQMPDYVTNLGLN
jgi:hypothetical protein